MNFCELKDACFDYFLHWKHMEEMREMSGGMPIYGMNQQRIEYHERILEITGLERERLRFLTDSMFEVKDKYDFYNKVLNEVRYEDTIRV